MALLLVLQLLSATGEDSVELPCGEDNLSCLRTGDLSVIPLRCYMRDELCNGTEFCVGGSDEGNIPALECKPFITHRAIV